MDSTTLSTILFLTFVAATLFIVWRASRTNKKSTDFYDGGASFSGFQNGLAIAGDYMSAASFLGIAGTIALFGYDGFLYSIGFLVAWLVALLLIAEPLRNSGRFTMGDVLAFRMRQVPVRTAAAVSTLVVSIFYLMAQMVGAGALVSLLLGITDPGQKNLIIVGVGILMILYVTIGGMKGTTYVQILKAFLLMTGAALLTIMVLLKFNFNISDLLGAAAENSGKGDTFLQPGLKFGKDIMDATGAIDPVKTLWSKLDLISLGLALVLGTAGLPHILIRFYTVPTSKAARKSVNWAIGNIGAFYLMTIALGFGAAAFISRASLFRGFKADPTGCFIDAKGAAIAAGDNACVTADTLKTLDADTLATVKLALVPVDTSGNVAAPQLAEFLGGGAGTTGGAIMIAIIGAIAFATILAVVAGLVLASSSSFAHDLYASVIKKGNASPEKEVRVAKIAAIVIGAVSIFLAIGAQTLNVAFLVAIAFAIAASGNLPAVLYSLFWKKFNTRGAVWAIYGGLFSALILLVLSPNVTGLPTSLIPLGLDGTGFRMDVFPLANPGIVSIPLGFIFGWLGTVTSNERNTAKYAELEVRSMTGAALGKAAVH
jgi:cation/acetate symporter